jgi:hypothetical protein
VLPDVSVRNKRGLGRGIVENDALPTSRLVRGLQSGRSPRRPARRGSRNCLGNFPPRSAAAGDARPERPGAAVARRPVRIRNRRLGPARRKSDIRLPQGTRMRSRAAVAPSMRRPWPLHNPLPYSAPAIFGSRTNTQRSPRPGCWTNGVRCEAHGTARRQSNRNSASSRGASESARVAV